MCFFCHFKNESVTNFLIQPQCALKNAIISHMDGMVMAGLEIVKAQIF